MLKSGNCILKWSICLSVISVILLLGGILLFCAVLMPDSAIGYTGFRVAYALPMPKDFILEKFRFAWDEYNNEYVGAPVYSFLGSRLETTDSKTEQNELINFYIRDALEERRGGLITTSSEENKQKIIALILSKLDNYEPQKAMGALLVVEYLRTGKALCFPEIHPNRFSNSPELHEEDFKLNWEDWWQQIGLPKAKAKYREWWNTNLDWEQKRQIKPLQDSSLYIVEHCG